VSNHIYLRIPIERLLTPASNRFTKRIIELSYDESAVILEYLFRLTTENHDLQVRYRWEK
jgi:alpha-ketoglutarate-dependent taurine dioxygenase